MLTVMQSEVGHTVPYSAILKLIKQNLCKTVFFKDVSTNKKKVKKRYSFVQSLKIMIPISSNISA